MIANPRLPHKLNAFLGTWAGDDIDNMLAIVYKTRSKFKLRDEMNEKELNSMACQVAQKLGILMFDNLRDVDDKLKTRILFESLSTFIASMIASYIKEETLTDIKLEMLKALYCLTSDKISFLDRHQKGE